MKSLLSLTKKKDICRKSPNRSAKSKCIKENHHRTHLQIPKDQSGKLNKSASGRGSWPGPEAENISLLLDSNFSKSEQQLNIYSRQSDETYPRKYSNGSDVSSSRYVTVHSASSSVTSHSGVFKLPRSSKFNRLIGSILSD